MSKELHDEYIFQIYCSFVAVFYDVSEETL